MLVITDSSPELSPEKKETKCKEQLKLARIHLLNAQVIVRPFDERYTQIEKILEPLEEMIMKRPNT